MAALEPEDLPSHEYSRSPTPSFDPPLPMVAESQSQSPGPLAENERPSKRARVEDIEDEEDIDMGGLPREPWIEDYPLDAGSIRGTGKTTFEAIREMKTAAEESHWAPFDSAEEWALARWLLTSGLSQTAIDEYLQLEIVSEQCI